MSVKQVSKELSVIEKRTGVQQLSAQKKVNKQQVNKKQESNKQEKSKEAKKKEAREASDEQRRVKIKWTMKWEKTSEHQTRKTKTSEKQTSK